MSSEYFTYECESCKKMSRIKDGDPIPRCCGELMKRLDAEKKETKDTEIS